VTASFISSRSEDEDENPAETAERTATARLRGDKLAKAQNVLDVSFHWRHLANAIERSARGDAALCQIREHISGTTRPILAQFSCMLPMSVARSFSGGRAILSTSGFMHDVIFAHNDEE